MENPPLRPLHLNSVLSRAKLNHYAGLTTEGFDTFTSARTNRRSQSTSRWTVIDGHHRIAVLRDRGIGVNELPREVLTKSDTS
jgi:hypothetical protein